VPLVTKISVSKVQNDSFKIIVSPAEYLGMEPMLEALDDPYVIRAERGQQFDWVFYLARLPKWVAETTPKRDRGRFRLEIIR
jgi:hypothetical protein